jgi:hypothetical protein
MFTAATPAARDGTLMGSVNVASRLWTKTFIPPLPNINGNYSPVDINLTRVYPNHAFRKNMWLQVVRLFENECNPSQESSDMCRIQDVEAQ